MKLLKKIMLVSLSVVAFMVGVTVSADEDTCLAVPSMPMSQIIEQQVPDAIVSDFDIPDYPEPEDNASSRASYMGVFAVLPFGSNGCWEYKYTADPYSFFKHTGTGQWRMVQTTSTVNHTVNTMIGGYVGAPSALTYYNPAYKNLLGGC